MGIQEHKREQVESGRLQFNSANPRLFGESDEELNTDIEIIRVLSTGSDIAELVISIIENTFVDYEPMVVTPVGKDAKGNVV